MAEKILIVDDDVDTLKLVGLMLQRQGYEIVAANNGAQALQKAAAESPNLILLDVMMPDMDGYEVTRRLRNDPTLAHIPIIMFTAKTLVDDKVAGFEAGADDYLTKPTHPAELTAHVKALLARATAARAAPIEKAQVIGVMGAKGGLGATTLALNIGVALAQAGQDTIVAELRPGQGALGMLLGFTRASGLSTLLGKSAGEINLRTVEGQLQAHGSGIRLLLASHNPSEVGAAVNSASQLEAIVRHLSALCKTLVLDLGPGISEATRRLIALCDQMVVVVEPQKVTLNMGKSLLSELEGLGMGQARVAVVTMNRARSSLQTPLSTTESILGRSTTGVISPAPELAYQAAEGGVPMILMQADGLVADQYRQIARHVAGKIK